MKIRDKVIIVVLTILTVVSLIGLAAPESLSGQGRVIPYNDILPDTQEVSGKGSIIPYDIPEEPPEPKKTKKPKKNLPRR